MLPEPLERHSTDVESRVRRVLAEKLGRDPASVGLDDDLLVDLGLDSLSIAELTVAIEQEIGQTLPGDQLLEATTVGDLVRLLEPAEMAGPHSLRGQ